MDEQDEQLSRKIRIMAKKTGIKHRYSVIADYERTPENFTFFPSNKHLEPMPSLSARMAIYRHEALKLSLDAVNKIKNFSGLKAKITHIITVTCTGLFAPGLDIELMRELQLKPTTGRASINFMGCNAAVLALKQADQVCKSQPDALVLIVCTELCTIHVQKKYTDDYILSNLLFADGAAAALVSTEQLIVSEEYVPLEIKSFQSVIIHEGQNDMAWQLSESGFVMNLTSYVSGLINKNIPGVLRDMGVTAGDVQHWAIHPGGKKILEDFCHTMSMQDTQLKHSYKVLENYGNMSSPTILFVLQSLLASGEVKEDETVYAAAFGPGLSIESVMLKHV
jgi:predicted naringenin-chalcone synthase